MGLLRKVSKMMAGTRRIHRVPVGSYEDYVRTQNEGNARKLRNVFARPRNIEHLARYIVSHIGPRPRIICHGTRNGAELRFFLETIPEADILGTEIAETATQFPHTIQWDFHDLKPEWVEAWDVVYSNSWDHAFDPEMAFGNWMRSLRPGGMMLLDHTECHTPAHTNKLDPFGAKLPALIDLLNRIGNSSFRVTHVIDDLPDTPLGERTIVLRRC